VRLSAYLVTPEPGPLGVRVEPLGDELGPIVAGWIHVGVGAVIRARSGACGASAAPNRASAGSSRAGTHASGTARSGTSAATAPPPAPPPACANANVLASANAVADAIVVSFMVCLPWLVTKNKSRTRPIERLSTRWHRQTISDSQSETDSRKPTSASKRSGGRERRRSRRRKRGLAICERPCGTA
jgi:hypothetical protein